MILQRTAEIENFDVEMSCSRHGLTLRHTSEIGDLVFMFHDSATPCGDPKFDVYVSSFCHALRRWEIRYLGYDSATPAEMGDLMITEMSWKEVDY